VGQGREKNHKNANVDYKIGHRMLNHQTEKRQPRQKSVHPSPIDHQSIDLIQRRKSIALGKSKKKENKKSCENMCITSNGLQTHSTVMICAGIPLQSHAHNMNEYYKDPKTAMIKKKLIFCCC
jgi:hypothetical protein